MKLFSQMSATTRGIQMAGKWVQNSARKELSTSPWKCKTVTCCEGLKTMGSDRRPDTRPTWLTTPRTTNQHSGVNSFIMVKPNQLHNRRSIRANKMQLAVRLAYDGGGGPGCLT